MSELKNCPHCNKVMTQDSFYSEDGYPQGCHCWEECNTSKKAEEIWNTRPLESELQSALTTAQEENKRYKDALESIRSEGIRWGEDADASRMSFIAKSALMGGK